MTQVLDVFMFIFFGFFAFIIVCYIGALVLWICGSVLTAILNGLSISFSFSAPGQCPTYDRTCEMCEHEKYGQPCAYQGPK